MIPNAIHITNNNKSKINNKQIISVGRLSEEKGYLDLIDIMKYVVKTDKNIKLIICGTGHQKEQIENKIKELSLENNIILKGFLKEEKLYKEYINSSLYVLPSISEAFGLVLLEAMHFGLPVIAFDTASGARNLLKNDVGLLIKDRNKKEFARQIINLLNNQELLKKYQNKSLNEVKKYDTDVIKKEWLKILK